jgi:hypothetical protein
VPTARACPEVKPADAALSREEASVVPRTESVTTDAAATAMTPGNVLAHDLDPLLGDKPPLCTREWRQEGSPEPNPCGVVGQALSRPAWTRAWSLFLPCAALFKIQLVPCTSRGSAGWLKASRSSWLQIRHVGLGAPTSAPIRGRDLGLINVAWPFGGGAERESGSQRTSIGSLIWARTSRASGRPTAPGWTCPGRSPPSPHCRPPPR